MTSPEPPGPLRTGVSAPAGGEADPYRGFFDRVPVGLFRTDAAGRIADANPALAEILGLASPADLLGVEAVGYLVDPAARRRLVATLARHGSLASEAQVGRPDGSTVWIRCHLRARRSGRRLAGADGVVEDVTAAHEAEARLLRDALHDALTGLPNRVYFHERLTRCLEAARREPEQRFAMLFLDLDRFKLVNDSFGHAVGDRLLIDVGEWLRGCLRPTDVLARLGGDEFGVLVERIASLHDATRVAGRILTALEIPFHCAGREVYTGGSIGIAIGGAETETAEELLRNADIALYRAKGDGRSGYAVFDGRMHAEVLARVQLETDLRRDLERGRFAVHYQPIVELDGGEVVGVEALARWNHRDGMIFPSAFIPTAEETGLINLLGQRVLHLACRQAATWTARPGMRPFRLSVNLSNRQLLQRDLVERVTDALAASGFPADRLVLEITESLVLEKPDAVEATLAGLKALGVRLSLDDFGIGYSSLAVLHRLPIDSVKIDRWFVARLGIDRGAEELIEGVLALCRARKLTAVAEGIETVEQHRRLLSLGCRLGQGFLFAGPLPAAQAERRLSAEAAAATIATGARPGA